ncbi:MAG: T9SS type A sorting domain-containing protein, partial [Saprospiraceae bacterium]|nr:T9SS type A sorting domain-containing protein [Saprospiraceae bacterium]
PGQFKIVWLDDDVDQGLFHANFKLSASGEFIGIFNNENYGYSLIDGFSFDQQTPDISYGRIPNGTGPLVFMEPTPGASNAPDATENPGFPDPMVIYPNPFNKDFYFLINESEGKPLRWQLTDTSGKVLFEQNQWITSEKVTVETGHLSNGVYLLMVETADGRRQTAKVVKVK